MKYFLSILYFCGILTWGFGQEILNDSIISYEFHTELRYASTGEDSSGLVMQHGNEAMKITYPQADFSSYIMVDLVNRLIATENPLKKEVKKFDELPEMPEASKTITFKKIDEITYKEYECERFQINLEGSLIEVYFEKKGISNLNLLFLKLLEARGVQLKVIDLPKGKFVAGMEIRDGIAKDTLELRDIKENQKISFSLKTKI